MKEYTIEIDWEGPFTLERVIKDHRNYDVDCGLYQLYGPHILYGGNKKNVLLYIGETRNQNYSGRMKNHKKDLLVDDDQKVIRVFLGRLRDKTEYSKVDDWKVWRFDVALAERIMIYKYLPSYNSSGIKDYPTLKPYKRVILKHFGRKQDLKSVDIAPVDY